MSGRIEILISEFRDLAALAAAFSAGNEVVFRIANEDDALRRRVVDFASGLAYERAHISKTQDYEYVLTPAHA